jgi:hypothetical protein
MAAILCAFGKRSQTAHQPGLAIINLSANALNRLHSETGEGTTQARLVQAKHQCIARLALAATLKPFEGQRTHNRLRQTPVVIKILRKWCV